MPDPDETADEPDFHCENCRAAVSSDDVVGMCDCWFCPACYAEWRAQFDACDHVWEPATDPVHGDPGRYCPRCAGFLFDEDLAA